jgi:hypothetical protein
VRKQLFLVCVSSFALAVTSSAASITDGTFSSPSVVSATNGFEYNPTGSAWTFTGASGIAAQGQPTVAPWYTITAPGGSGQAAFLQNYVGPNTLYSGHPGIISQFITGLTAGDSYTLSLFAAQRPSYNVNPFTISVGGASIGSVTPGSTVFNSYSETFTATGTTELLAFTSNPGPTTGNFDFDSILADVTLRSNVTSVPEPATSALLLSGLGGLAFYMRRKSQNRQA